MMKPFLKWVGGKTQIIDQVLTLFPTQMENYYEPFVGGGSVLLALLSHVKEGKIQVKGKIYVSDLNSILIGLYKNIQSCPEKVIEEVNTMVTEFESCIGTEVNRKPTTKEQALTSQESYYYWIRTRFNALSNEERTKPIASAMFLFLNKTCFRGVYREGPHGFNVPYGNYKHPTVLEENHIREVAALLKDVVFTTCSFTDVLSKVKKGDFVYVDPPYAPESGTSFVSYTKDGFDLKQHELLFKQLKEMNTSFLMSNADVQLVKDAFPNTEYETKSIVCRRAINSKKPESKTTEVLITNIGH